MSDSDDGGPSSKPAPRKRGASAKKATYTISDDDDDMDEFQNDDFAQNDDDDGSDFEEEAPKKKAAPKAKKAAAPAKAPAAAKKPRAPKKTTAKSTPLAEASVNQLESAEPISFDSDESINKENNPSGTAPSSSKKPVDKDASSQYQKLTQLEHILKRPDTYIGSIERTEMKQWVFDPNSQAMEHKDVTIVPGLYKIFDEILVNAADNKIRDKAMNTLEVKIDVESNTISVYNNGKGIPIEIHKKEKIYIPELIFGNLLTSSNYDDDEKKVTGGRNGYGAKVRLLSHLTEFH